MKIQDSNLTGTAAAETHRSQEVQRSERGSSARSSSIGAGGDHVEFSGSLGRLSRTLSSFQSDRSARVQALAAQFQSGNYHSDSMSISRGILQEELSSGVQ